MFFCFNLVCPDSAIGLTLRVSNQNGEPVYSIDPNSVQTIYLGFK